MSIQSSFAPSPFVEPAAARPHNDAPDAERAAESFALPEETPPAARTAAPRAAAEAATAEPRKAARPSGTASTPTAASSSSATEADASVASSAKASPPRADALFALAVAAQTGEGVALADDGLEAPAEAGEHIAVVPSIELQLAVPAASPPAAAIDPAAPIAAAIAENPTAVLVAATLPDPTDAVATGAVRAQAIAATVAVAAGAATAASAAAASATASIAAPALARNQTSAGAPAPSALLVAEGEPAASEAVAPGFAEPASGDKAAARATGLESLQNAATPEAKTPDAAGVKLAEALQAAIGPIDLSAAQPLAIGKAEAALTVATAEQAAAPGAAAQGQGGNAGAATPVHVVPIEIGLRILSGARKFDIRLDPAELGRVDVNLEISDKGEVTARLVVDRVETLHLLQRDARTLERAFEQAGLKPSDAGVDITLRDPADQSGFRQNRDQDETPRRARMSDDGGDDAALHTQPVPVRRLVRLGGVDLSI